MNSYTYIFITIKFKKFKKIKIKIISILDLGESFISTIMKNIYANICVFNITQNLLWLNHNINFFLFLSFIYIYMIFPQKSIGWWVSNTDDLKAWSWKQIISQRGPMGTGQKSSDDEVSKLIILNHERYLFFWKISI